MAPRYSPGCVVCTQVQRVPDGVIGSDGWIDGTAMQDFVRQALQNTISGIRDFGDGSYQVRSWQDVDMQDRPLAVTCGQWTTFPGPTPPDLLKRLTDAGVPPPESSLYQYRTVEARYWTERYAGLAKPGGFYLGLNVYHSPNATAPGVGPEPGVLEHVAQRARLLCDDFLQAL